MLLYHNLSRNKREGTQRAQRFYLILSITYGAPPLFFCNYLAPLKNLDFTDPRLKSGISEISSLMEGAKELRFLFFKYIHKR